ncbi:MAG: hypothetical protein E6G96_17575 [Alphaproteobacteria bacterium]|nr:MAG: hypothetical protein E6G96_17575 [Alphaproteobacteria bacterium]
MDGIALRYGLLYGPGTWHDSAVRKPALHVDAAAQAASLAIGCGRAGIYNIADDVLSFACGSDTSPSVTFFVNQSLIMLPASNTGITLIPRPKSGSAAPLFGHTLP